MSGGMEVLLPSSGHSLCRLCLLACSSLAPPPEPASDQEDGARQQHDNMLTSSRNKRSKRSKRSKRRRTHPEAVNRRTACSAWMSRLYNSHAASNKGSPSLRVKSSPSRREGKEGGEMEGSKVLVLGQKVFGDRAPNRFMQPFTGIHGRTVTGERLPPVIARGRGRVYTACE
ncbi:hypothetical protein JOB18_018929 [Solea senegalensis]|uniref:Uncharacterized protein n=1 Tax=Solea senegalensis TaxID=28829 RepID=A0AAV6RHF7_SOLSE|nr:hypothetical protein JOB18_018929 [Solea senegalensis]